MSAPTKNNPDHENKKVQWLLADGARLHKCFISEKWCTFERSINNCLALKKNKSNASEDDTSDKKVSGKPPIPKAFVIMPFSEPYDQIFKLQIRPMLSGIDPPLTVSRADTIMRTGYVMCEKICKQIQEADLVVADITLAKQNVLYELGLAAGLSRRILLMAQDLESKGISSDTRSILSRLNLIDHEKSRKCFLYSPFSYIMTTAEELFNTAWMPPLTSDCNRQTVAKVGVLTSEHPVRFDSAYRPVNAASSVVHNSPPASLSACQLEDILKCVLGSVTRDIILGKKEFDTEEKYEEKLAGVDPIKAVNKGREKLLKEQEKLIKDNQNPRGDTEDTDPEILWMVIDSRRTDKTPFEELTRFVEDCECIIVDISANADPINFFWLGYSHAKGKNVIPVTVHELMSETPVVETPFDVRGLWHVYFETRRPENLKDQFMGIMTKIICDDVQKRAKRAFWEPFLRDVEIQILVGANLKQEPKRYMVGEWDYMTLAELAGFLSQEKPTLDIKIASPVYQIHQNKSETLSNVDEDTVQNTNVETTLDAYLKKMIEGKNCILIASPDVNVVTEMALAKAKNVRPFQSDILQKEGGFTGFVGYKVEETEKRRGFVHWRHMTATDFSSRYKFKPNETNSGTKKDVPPISPNPDEKKEGHSYTFYNKVAIDNKEKCPSMKDKELEPKPQDPLKPEEGYEYEGLYGYMAVFDNPYNQEKQEKKRILVLSGISGPATMAMAQILTGCVNPDVTVNGLLTSDERKNGLSLLSSLRETYNNEKKECNPLTNNSQTRYGLLENRIIGEGKNDDQKPGGILNDWMEAIENITELQTDGNNKVNADNSDGNNAMGKRENKEASILDYSSFSEQFLVELNKKIGSPNNVEALRNVEALCYVVIGDAHKKNHIEWKDSRRILLWGFANCAAEDPTLDNPKEFVTNIRDIHNDYKWHGEKPKKL